MTAMGRPTRYDPEMCEQAHNYCLLGATNDVLAEFFGVDPSTIDRWIARHADFGDAVKRGRVIADARVARSLYDRALGCERKVERMVVVGGAVKRVTRTDHYPPDVKACIFWLRHRRRETWGDRSPASGSGSCGSVAVLKAASERARHEPTPSRSEVL